MKNLFELANMVEREDMIYVSLSFESSSMISTTSNYFTKNMILALAEECDGLVNEIYVEETYSLLGTKYIVTFDMEVEKHVLSVLEYECELAR